MPIGVRKFLTSYASCMAVVCLTALLNAQDNLRADYITMLEYEATSQCYNIIMLI